jgi:alpha-amylase
MTLPNSADRGERPRIRALAPWLALLVGCASSSSPAPPDGSLDEPDPEPTAAALAGWRQQVIYFVLPDRFRDGDPANNNATQCFDPADPRRFHGGDLEGLRQHLDYVRDVGATAVWITPPNRQAGPGGGCGYHGYWIDYTDPADDAIQPELGTSLSLERLASDLHASGMRLVLDMVVNHAGQTASLRQQHPDWFHDPATCTALGSPTIFCQIFDLPDLAQERAEVADYLSALEARAVTRYGADGIRMDTVKHVPAAYFRDSFFPAVRAAKPGVFVVGEIFETASLQTYLPYLDAGFDSAFHFPLYAAITDAIGRNGSVDGIAKAVADGIARVGAARALDLVLFINNHDVPRFANAPGLVPEDEIRRRLLLALDLIFTLPGIPQLYYGDELGMYGSADPDNRRDLPAWAGDAAARAEPHPGSAVPGSAAVYERVQKLAWLRRTVPALADGRYHELLRQGGGGNPNVLAFARSHGEGVRIVVIGNGARSSGTVRIPVPTLADGTVLVDELGDGAPASVEVSGGALSLEMPARSAAIYRIGP